VPKRLGASGTSPGGQVEATCFPYCPTNERPGQQAGQQKSSRRPPEQQGRERARSLSLAFSRKGALLRFPTRLGPDLGLHFATALIAQPCCARRIRTRLAALAPAIPPPRDGIQ